MEKKCKKQKQTPISNPNRDFEMRPVTCKEVDSWCYFPEVLPSDFDPRAPYGYVIDIPYIPQDFLLLEGLVSGYIIRAKKHRNHLLLQVVKIYTDTSYGICSFSREIGRRRKRRILHVSRTASSC
ncbi:MAG: hypothetical protein ACLU84_05840 [Clostridia bacterium]